MTLGTATKHDYGEPSYWDQRYRQYPEPFDWYQKYQSLAPLFDLYLRRSHRLLLVGCGNSGLLSLRPRLLFPPPPTDSSRFASETACSLDGSLGESMFNDGYQDVVNIDVSSIVIEAMQKKHMDKPGLKYIKVDVRDMDPFQSNSFDAVIDKGTLDSLMCGHNALPNATKMLQEVGRQEVLKDKGVYILITYGDPSYRLRMLRDIDLWTINMHVIERIEKSSGQKTWELITPLPLNEDGSSVAAVLRSNPEVHYIYVCIKDESRRWHQSTETNDIRNEQ
ncbi:hypothetical protein C4D60_Mb09t15270 [Musa balbisiana]|uniref:Methyltransferase domain-containing protein n=1 Tax=Musa balbisiana TaxID=52838 RepID=A0A4S8IGK0_MUSBA|nr:hypothetical protein C4D60_Mb09t15270 [Musa balbisiana]